MHIVSIFLSERRGGALRAWRDKEWLRRRLGLIRLVGDFIFFTRWAWYRRPELPFENLIRGSRSDIVGRRFYIDDLTRRAWYRRSGPDMIGRRFQISHRGAWYRRSELHFENLIQKTLYRKWGSDMFVRRFNVDDLTRRACYRRSGPHMVGRRFHISNRREGLDIVGQSFILKI